MIELSEKIRSLFYYTVSTIHFFRQQNFIKAYEFSQGVMINLQDCLTMISEEKYPEIYQNFLLALNMVSKGMEEQDEERLADMYQLEILPFLHQVLNLLSEEPENYLGRYWEAKKGNYWK